MGKPVATKAKTRQSKGTIPRTHPLKRNWKQVAQKLMRLGCADVNVEIQFNMGNTTPAQRRAVWSRMVFYSTRRTFVDYVDQAGGGPPNPPFNPAVLSFTTAAGIHNFLSAVEAMAWPAPVQERLTSRVEQPGGAMSRPVPLRC
mmetsp:Transcript_379/g.1301  ORF Transcript_379/g.1301 Transcript_379/m.1301 type:complete len:144 (-) Transcript_379:46-477(-)